MTFARVMEDFGRLVGIPEFDASSGVIDMECNGVAVKLVDDADHGRVAILVDAGSFPAERYDDVVGLAADANAATIVSGGHVLVAMREENRCYCATGLRVDGLPPEEFERVLARLIEKAQAARELIAALDPASSDKAPAASAGEHELIISL